MKLFARAQSGRKKRGKLFRFGWKLSLLGLLVASGLGVLFFFGAWAGTFVMKKVGEMLERNTVFDVDGKIFSRLAGANRLKFSIDQVSLLYINAVLARTGPRSY